MSLRMKLIITGLSIVSLIFSLISPSEEIFLSLIPIMFTPYYWVYEDKETNSIKYKLMRNTAFIILSICLLVLLFFSFTSTVQPVSNKVGSYEICFSSNIVGIGGNSYDYLPVAIGIVLIYFLLAVFDVINHCLSNEIIKQSDNRTFAQRVA